MVTVVGTPQAKSVQRPMTPAELKAAFHPTISDARAATFVDAWAKRIADGSFQAFLDAPGVPDTIRAEGFHDLDAQTNGYLIELLAQRIAAMSPPLRSRLDGPDGTKQRAELLTGLYTFIFEKDSLQQPQLDAPKPVDTPDASEALPSADLQARIANMQEAGRAKPVTTTGMVMQDLAAYGLTQTAEAPAIAPPAGSPLPEQRIVPPITDILRMLFGERADYFTQSYRLCASPADVCSAPTSPNTPSVLDVDRDNVPDVAGSIDVLPDVALSPGPGLGLKVQMTVDRLASSLNQHVYVALDFASLSRRFTLGIDGRDAGLPLRAEMAFTIKNLLAPIPGSPELDAVLSLTQIGALGGVSLTVGTASLPNLDDPLLLSIAFDGVNFNGETIVKKDDYGLHIEYIATSALSMQAVYSDVQGQSFTATLDDLPATITLDITSDSVTWNASDAVAGIYVDAALELLGRRWYAGLRLEQIPAAWYMFFSSDGRVLFETLDAPVGSLAGYLSNQYIPSLPTTNFASAFIDTANPDITLAFRINAIERFELTPSSKGWKANFMAGGGAPFTVTAALVHRAQDFTANASVVIDPLPRSITLEQKGSSFTYDASSNLTLIVGLDAGFGTSLSVTPTPVVTNGIAVTDGYSCPPARPCGYGVKMRLKLAGMPTHVGFNGETKTFDMRNLDTGVTGGAFAIDVTLDDLHLGATALPAAKLALSQGLGTSEPIDIVASMAQTNDTNSKKTTVSFTVTRAGTATLHPLGLFHLYVGFGPAMGEVIIENVPGKIVESIDFQNGTTVLSSTLEPNGITRLEVNAAVVTNVFDVRAGLKFTNVPSSMSLNVGRQGDINSTNVPGLSYTANADTLDITAYVLASLFGGDIKAKLNFGVTNIGRSTTGTFDSSTRKVSLNSSPQTDSIELSMHGRLKHELSFGPVCYPGCGDLLRVRVDNGVNGGAATAGFNVAIDNLGFTLVGVKTFGLTLGVTSAIEGDFTSFKLGWDTFSVGYKIDVGVFAQIDINCCGFDPYTITFVDYHVNSTLNVSVIWHIAENTLGKPDYSNGLFHYDTPVPCGCHGFACLDIDYYDLDIKLRPHALRYTTNNFTVTKPLAANGNAWLVTPDPFDLIPDFGVFAVARYMSPMGGETNVSFPCND